MDPIERLKDERHRCSTPTAEDDPVDRDAVGIINLRVKDRIINHRGAESAVRVSGRLSFFPWVA